MMLSFVTDDKKADIRSKIWNYLDKNELSLLFSPFKKISNFKVVVSYYCMCIVELSFYSFSSRRMCTNRSCKYLENVG